MRLEHLGAKAPGVFRIAMLVASGPLDRFCRLPKETASDNRASVAAIRQKDLVKGLPSKLARAVMPASGSVRRGLGPLGRLPGAAPVGLRLVRLAVP